MSLWPEAARIWLSPAGAVAVRGRARARGVEARVLGVEAPGGGWAAPGEAVDAIAGALAQAGARRGAAWDVIVSDRYVRYLALPWREGLRGRAEWEAYARHRYAEVYGEAAHGWVLRVASGVPGQARIAAAVDAAMLERLAAAGARAGARLARVVPNFCNAADRHHAALRGGRVWLALAEPGWLCAGRLERGHCTRLERRRAADDPGATLRTLLAEARLAEGAPAGEPERVLATGLAADAAGGVGEAVELTRLGRPAEVPEAAWRLGFA